MVKFKEEGRFVVKFKDKSDKALNLPLAERSKGKCSECGNDAKC